MGSVAAVTYQDRGAERRAVRSDAPSPDSCGQGGRRPTHSRRIAPIGAWTSGALAD
jgi:hypothetical protein